MAGRAKGRDPLAEARSVSPAELRGQLATDLGEDYDLLVSTLSEAMGTATKDVWLTCRRCGDKAAHPGPDYRTRVDAAARWMELSLGRQREEAKRPEVNLTAKTREEMRALSDDELAIIAAGE